jgi:hypothetical protein
MSPTDTRDVVEVKGLVKRFGALAAVDDLSFSIRRGEIFGILGPQRQRQDDHDPHAVRAHPAQPRHRGRGRRPTSRASPNA